MYTSTTYSGVLGLTVTKPGIAPQYIVRVHLTVSIAILFS